MGNVNSYISANTLPAKMFIDSTMITDIKNHCIKPIHIQINPTNKCPLNCSFCSCRNRDKGKSFDWIELKSIIEKYISIGTKAVTITGGGDPLAYTYINELISFLGYKKIDTGFVTNGLLFDRLDKELIQNITWCRVSISDENIDVLTELKHVVKFKTDWALSYVMIKGYNNANIARAIDFTNKYGLTHLRIVEDILHDDDTNIEEVKTYCKENGINDSKVIYQGRKLFTKGNKRCLISLLKPNIDPEGNIFPCCGIQYATEEQTLGFDKKLSLGIISEIQDIFKSQKYFDGSVCTRCYYSEYNDLLNIIWDSGTLKHQNFI